MFYFYKKNEKQRNAESLTFVCTLKNY